MNFLNQIKVSYRFLLVGCMSLLLAALLIAVAAQAASPAIKAPQVDTPKRVLFVGNSYFFYSGSVHFYTRRIALAVASRHV